MTDLADYVDAYKNLQDKSPQELVDLALEHIVNVTPLENLLLQELCSRVDPGWESREPKPEPVAGVVRGSELEKQIQLARKEIAKWPASVRAAMKIQG